MRIDITCSTDENYAQHCLAMLCSLYDNNKAHDVYSHILINELEEETKKEFFKLSNRYGNTTKFYSINNDILKNVNRRENSPVSIATYYRVMLPELLDTSIKKVFYLDCDVIVLKDISELFNINLDGFGVAAIKDPTPANNYHRSIMGLQLDDRAFCAGVMMINLEYWRENNAQQALLDYSNTKQKKVVLEDQDALNYVFRRHWFKLPYKFGKTPFSIYPAEQETKMADALEFAYDPAIIHYASGNKPWLDVWVPYRKYYWKYVDLSGKNNPKVTKTDNHFKFATYKTTLRYFINKYLRPFLPDFLEIIIKDIFYAIKGFFCLFSPRSFKKFILKRWMNKYNI